MWPDMEAEDHKRLKDIHMREIGCFKGTVSPDI